MNVGFDMMTELAILTQLTRGFESGVRGAAFAMMLLRNSVDVGEGVEA